MLLSHTFLAILQLSHDLFSLCLLCCSSNAEGALPCESGPVGVKSGRDPALLFPLLLPLQTRGERTAHGVTETLPLKHKSLDHTSHCKNPVITQFHTQKGFSGYDAAGVAGNSLY